MQVQQCIRRDPSLATMKLSMNNNNSTMILHQATSDRSNAQGRAAVIKTILEVAPVAASIANGQGTLPIHTILQCNMKMDSQTRGELVKALINAYPESLLKLCRAGKWQQVQQCIQCNPSFATMKLSMDNNNLTTILHQATSDRSNTQGRVAVIKTILEVAPVAASIANGKGTLPIHTILQRNVKMDSQSREEFVKALINAYPESLLKVSGIGSRTPLHIALTDSVSPGLIHFMVAMGPRACFMRDRKGYLPIHIACSRHCSPKKLRIILAVNPTFLFATTPENESPLELARSKATEAHPNTKLIKELEVQSRLWAGVKAYNELELMEEGVTPPPPLFSTANQVLSPQVVPRAPGLIADTVPSRGPASAAEALLHLANSAMPQVGVSRAPQTHAPPLQASQSDPDSIAVVIHDGAPDSEAQAVAYLDDREVEQHAEV
jgi:hypothetical protein